MKRERHRERERGEGVIVRVFWCTSTLKPETLKTLNPKPYKPSKSSKGRRLRGPGPVKHLPVLLKAGTDDV